MAGQELDAGGVIRPKLGQKLVAGQVFAAERKHQYAAGVRVAGQRRKQFAGLGVVGPGLGAAVRVRKGVQPFDAAGDKILIVPRQRLGDIVDTADSRDDPELIADGRTAVRPAEAHKALRRNGGQWVQVGGVGVFNLARKVGFEVVGVHPAAGGDVGRRVADREAVFDDVLAGADRRDGHLVTLGDILGCCDGLPAVGQFHRRAPRKGAQRHDDIVGRVDVDGERHGGSFSRGRAAQMKNEKLRWSGVLRPPSRIEVREI